MAAPHLIARHGILSVHSLDVDVVVLAQRTVHWLVNESVVVRVAVRVHGAADHDQLTMHWMSPDPMALDVECTRSVVAGYAQPVVC